MLLNYMILKSGLVRDFIKQETDLHKTASFANRKNEFLKSLIDKKGV